MKKWVLLTLVVIVAFGLGYGVQHLTAKEKQRSINEQEATGIIQSMYGADITKLVRNGDHYDIEMQNKRGTYAVKMDEDTGEITSLTLIKKNVQKPDETKQTENPETPEAKISKQEAADIALSKVKGKVDDIDLEKMDGSYVYKVEIETDNEDAYVYIQAYTGEILSYTFEKDDDDD